MKGRKEKDYSPNRTACYDFSIRALRNARYTMEVITWVLVAHAQERWGTLLSSTPLPSTYGPK